MCSFTLQVLRRECARASVIGRPVLKAWPRRRMGVECYSPFTCLIAPTQHSSHGMQSFLHVGEQNASAKSLYEKLNSRREIVSVTLPLSGTARMPILFCHFYKAP